MIVCLFYIPHLRYGTPSLIIPGPLVSLLGTGFRRSVPCLPCIWWIPKSTQLEMKSISSGKAIALLKLNLEEMKSACGLGRMQSHFSS